MTFLVSIPFWVLAYLTRNLIPEGFPLNPLGLLTTLAPITAAIILNHREKGLESATSLIWYSLDYKSIPNIEWYLQIVFIFPLIYLSTLGLMNLIGVQSSEIQISFRALPILFLFCIIFALFEEVGWQGYAFNLMEKRWNTLKASIFLGIIWALWHLPLFILQNPPDGILWIIGQSSYIILLRVLIVRIYNYTGKSVFSAILLHTFSNFYSFIIPVFDNPMGPIISTIMTAIMVITIMSLLGHAHAQEEDFILTLL